MSVPDWAIDTIQEARQATGLSGADWSFSVLLSDKPGGDAENLGFIRVNAVYQNATIELRDDIADDQTGHAAIYHEVLHAWHQPVDDLFETLLDKLPAGESETLEQVYRDRIENQIQRLARALVAERERLEIANGR